MWRGASIRKSGKSLERKGCSKTGQATERNQTATWLDNGNTKRETEQLITKRTTGRGKCIHKAVLFACLFNLFALQKSPKYRGKVLLRYMAKREKN